MKNATFPLLYQVNTRVWLTELSANLDHHATLDDIPESLLDHFAEKGFEWIWMLSVWTTGETGQQISRRHPGWLEEYRDTLPDLKEEDIAGSGFAITRYEVSANLGGNDALSRFRKKLSERGLKLMLDFVPNHTAIDHHWVKDKPDFYIQAGTHELETQPENFIRVNDRILAHGRDPFFSGWVDTLQLNYANEGLQNAMADELAKISSMCDGVRCDMAMLALPDVFERTWGMKCKPFWPLAIQSARQANSNFCLLAEVYWDMEWIMLEQGFNYAYDKRLYDRLKAGKAIPVREHLYAGLDYQGRMARFLENHDESRAAVEFAPGLYEAAAVITYLTPGLRFFHQGQLTGKQKKISAHLIRGPVEPVNQKISDFYEHLLQILQRPVFGNGHWRLLECASAWEGNPTWENFICFAWNKGNDEHVIIIVNYSWHDSQCYVKLPFPELTGNSWSLVDLFSDQILGRDGNDLFERGLYMDEPGWKYYAFILSQDKSDM